jgi:FixJ family two-component response regulator
MPDAANIFVIDDDAAVRKALSRVIATAGYNVRAFGSAQEFLDSDCHRGRGCLLLDVRMPDVDGVALHRKLQESGALLPVIFMTGFGDIPASVQAIKAGAVDYLPKPVSADALLSAIDAAVASEERLAAEHDEVSELRRRFESLTPRERDVFGLVLAGRLNKQIARELSISEKTVKVHRGRMMAKMGTRRVTQLVQFAVRLGIGPTEARGQRQTVESSVPHA